jgi:hypothetical protein
MSKYYKCNLNDYKGETKEDPIQEVKEEKPNIQPAGQGKKINFVHCNIDNNFDKWQAGILKELEARIKELESSRRILSTFVDDNTRNFTKQHCEVVDLKKQITELKKDFDDLVNNPVFSVIHPDTREPGIYVKSKDEIVKWLEANGYKEDENGVYVCRCVSFVVDMFYYCGKKINTEKEYDTDYGYHYYDYYYIWIPEWLEEVPGKSGENIGLTAKQAVDNLNKNIRGSLKELAEGNEKTQEVFDSLDLKIPSDKPQEILTADEWKKVKIKLRNLCNISECDTCFMEKDCNEFERYIPRDWDL